VCKVVIPNLAINEYTTSDTSSHRYNSVILKSASHAPIYAMPQSTYLEQNTIAYLITPPPLNHPIRGTSLPGIYLDIVRFRATHPLHLLSAISIRVNFRRS